ncbi:RNA polymerase sigma-70 factor (ECF subfamily) [Fluviicoccus keumensis]|uniref:RNA polymerase sigma-70 factor (ECF subfamily) n=1 Tax=Fluviicoccus keumensis TaxID=1435465 RepID=A0A4Q7ZBA4_9GAMM|nr:sigma-70 family RNA polymerase sigma factor [Fluviicoccus keumensis]RZU47243.1 RNA polymerase sigma-70 factor (ECF subfamily) [Fluviicoccus keumensis]
MTDDLTVLLGKTALGDQRAFEQLYRLSAPRLYGLALLVTRRKDLAEEALQDAYVSIWHSAHSFAAERGSAHAWLSTIVRNRCLDKLRRQKLPPTDLSPREWEEIAADCLEPSESVEAAAEIRRLNQCLTHLDDNQRRSVVLAYLQGLSHSELAVRMQAPLGTVKAWVRRGMDKLKGCLQL